MDVRDGDVVDPPTPDPLAGGFYRTLASGEVECGLCHLRQLAHTPECPVIVLRTQLRELTGQLGLFVATMRETLDGLERLLHGERATGNGHRP